MDSTNEYDSKTFKNSQLLMEEKEKLWKKIQEETDQTEKAYLLDAMEDLKYEIKRVREREEQERMIAKRKKEEEEEERMNAKRKREEVEWLSNPLSLFGSFNFGKPVIFDDVYILKSPFVNRVNELQSTWKTIMYNWDNREDVSLEKHVLLVSSQMFGSGKTAFGRNLFNFKNDHVLKQFECLEESKAKSHLRNVVTVAVSFQKEEFVHLATSLDQYISLKLWLCCMKLFCDPNDPSIYSNLKLKAIEFWRKRKPDVPKCYDILSILIGRPLYFHFDEIGSLTNIGYNSLFEKVDFSTPDPDLIEIRKYYLFWSSISVLLRDGVPILVSGKSARLTEIDVQRLGVNQSPTMAKQVRLPNFSARDILDILRESKIGNERSYLEHWCIDADSDEFVSVINWVLQITGGVPRLVCFALKEISALTNGTKSISIQLVERNHEKLIDSIAKAPNSMPSIEYWKNDPETLGLFCHVLVC